MRKFLLITAILISMALLITFPNQPRHQKPTFDLSTSKGLQAYLFEQKKLNKGRMKFDKPDAAMAEEVALRSEVSKPFAYKGSWRFDAQRQAISQNRFSLRKAAALNWVEHGPGNVGGRTRAVVVHPTNSNIWLVGAVGGGIWKTTDGGTTWACKTDDMPVISVTAIEICKNTPAILYAGTGEGFYNYDAIIGDGMFKSTDGGETWQQLASTVGNSSFRYVNRLIVDPANSDNLLAATNTGVYRSTNGGNSWTEVFNNGNRAQQIIANPSRFNTQFIAVNPSGIYKSTNGGLNWTYVSEEITDHNRIEMAISPTDTSVLYAAPVNSSYGLLGFYRSTDGGKGWRNYGNSTNWLGGQGWYDNCLVVSPLNPGIVFVGGIDIYRVTINGLNMTVDKITHWYSGAGYPYVHADQHALVTITTGASNFAIVAGNDGGIHYSADQGLNWQEFNSGYNVTQYYDADRHPSVSAFIGGTQDNGTYRSPDNPNAASDWSRVIGGDGFDCAWNKTAPDIVYGTLYSTRIYKSTDGGYNFSDVNNGMPESDIFHTPLAMDPANSEKLFTAGNSNMIYRTNNGAASWSSASVALGDYTYIKIAVSKTNSNIVWAGSTTIYNNVSTDGGQTFSQVTQPSGSPHAYLTGISTHPSESNTAFVTIGSSGSPKIFRTKDLGQTWENLNGNLPNVPVHTALVMPFDPTEIWIGTDVGLFISTDDGQSWQYSNSGIPAVSIRRLKIVDQYIVATTHGRGVWSVFREELPSGTLLAPTLQDITVPNPNTHYLKLRFTANSTYDSVQVRVNNQRIQTLLNVAAGTDTFGLYLTSPPQTITAQVFGYRGGAVQPSDQKSGSIYTAVEKLTENFDDHASNCFGDLTIQDEAGFSDAIYGTNHPYSNARSYISYLGDPITIKAGAYFSYRDVAIVEPGESGSVYPDPAFYDYVTVEGSNDGDRWTILIEPYDCRYDANWQSAYNNGSNGSESMLLQHTIDLTTNYALDENVYLRFRLYSDANTNGWGWAIDDLVADNVASGLIAEHSITNRFELIGNYPNPFNPTTTILFTLGKSAAVNLMIYNSVGQRVREIYRNQELPSGSLHQVKWDGKNEQNQDVASGTYFYRLTAGSESTVKKLLLLR
jgi:photosystem II stability/assembly factor-like uncharacterized protein